MELKSIRQKKTRFLALLIAVMFVILTGCASLKKTAPDQPENDQDHSDENHMQDSDRESADAVVLTVYGDYDHENQQNRRIEYPLSSDNSKIITDLFYNHEKTIIDTPTESIATLRFQIGEDYLTTSMSSLKTLSGRINGELVIINLSDSEYETVYQIVSQYAQNTL